MRLIPYRMIGGDNSPGEGHLSAVIGFLLGDGWSDSRGWSPRSQEPRRPLMRAWGRVSASRRWRAGLRGPVGLRPAYLRKLLEVGSHKRKMDSTANAHRCAHSPLTMTDRGHPASIRGDALFVLSGYR